MPSVSNGNVWKWLCLLCLSSLASALAPCFQVCECEKPVIRCNLTLSTYIPTFYDIPGHTTLEIYGSQRITELPTVTFEATFGILELAIIDTDIASLSPSAFRGLTSLSTIRLRGNSFKKIPRFALADRNVLKHLYINDCPIETLLRDDLSNNGKLVTLDLSDNSITDIDIRAFTNMNSLKRLILRGNKLRGLKSRQFQITGTPKLDMLDLSHNQIETILKDSFNGIGPRLYILDLSYNRITQDSWKSVLSAFPSIKKLVTLNVSGNPIQNMDSDSLRSSLPNLLTLELANCSLSEFTWDDFGRLRSLNVSGNRLPLGDLKIENKNRTCAPAEGDKDPDVECPEISVDVSGNNLRSLTVLVDYSLSLENVNVVAHNCSIDKARVRIIQNTTGKDASVLLSLSLSGNRFQDAISLHIDELGESQQKLSVNLALDLSNNQLTSGLEFPLKIFISNESASYDEINSCLLTNRSIEIKELDLSGNAITSIPQASCLVRQIGVLKLNRNKIRQIGELSLDGTAVGFNRTRVIELRENELSSIDALAFDGLPSLEVLDLRGNNITGIPEMTYLKSLKQFRLLALDNNPLRCDLRLTWMAGYPSLFPAADFRKKRVTGRCLLPPDTEGYSALCFSREKGTVDDSSLSATQRYHFGKVCEGDPFFDIKGYSLSVKQNKIHVVWQKVGPALVYGYRISYRSSSMEYKGVIFSSSVSNTTLSLPEGYRYQVCLSAIISDSIWSAQIEYCDEVSTAASATVIGLAVAISLIGVCLITVCIFYFRSLSRKPKDTNTYLHAREGQNAGNMNELYDDACEGEPYEIVG